MVGKSSHLTVNYGVEKLALGHGVLAETNDWTLAAGSDACAESTPGRAMTNT